MQYLVQDKTRRTVSLKETLESERNIQQWRNAKVITVSGYHQVEVNGKTMASYNKKDVELSETKPPEMASQKVEEKK